MTSSEKVSAYIKKHSQWEKQLTSLRSVINKTQLTEEIKWGAPSYSFNGKNVLGIGAFKNHYGIWFHQGVFLKDSHKVLLNAQEGKTRAMRQWRFEKNDVIDEGLVLKYVNEAIENCLAGKEIKPTRKKGLEIPDELASTFARDKNFKSAFQKLTPGKQREYAEYITQAKRAETKQKRIEKIIPMILAGTGLHDKYKNC